MPPVPKIIGEKRKRSSDIVIRSEFRLVLSLRSSRQTKKPKTVFLSSEVLTIQVGDTVTWTNGGGRHNVSADDSSFRCANGCDGEGGDGTASTASWSFSITFNDPETVRYFCEIHGGPGGAGMSGVITVEGGGGEPPPDAPKVFNSSFEEEDFADWDDHFCPSCNAVTAFVARQRAVAPAPPYRSRRWGVHRARLEVPPGTDFDLSLERRSATGWESVATSDSAEPVEEISFTGSAGRYRWVVSSRSGHGNFRLVFQRPALGAADPNVLLREASAKKKGKFGLLSRYEKGSKNKDYLIDQLPVEAKEYDINFFIRPDADLFVKGKKTVVLQLRSQNKTVVELRLAGPREGDDFRLQLRARSGKKLSVVGEIGLKAGKHVKYRLVWKAATAEDALDGLVRLFRKKKKLLENVELDNDADWVVELRVGQVSKSKGATDGVVAYDVLKSKFDVRE